jgi:hypothetical protein
MHATKALEEMKDQVETHDFGANRRIGLNRT